MLFYYEKFLFWKKEVKEIKKTVKKYIYLRNIKQISVALSFTEI